MLDQPLCNQSLSMAECLVLANLEEALLQRKSLQTDQSVSLELNQSLLSQGTAWVVPQLMIG